MEAISCKKNRKDIRTVIKLATNRKTIKIQQGHLYIKSHERIKPVAETHNRTLRSSVNGALAVPRSLIGHIRIQHSNCGIRFRFQFTKHHLLQVLKTGSNPYYK